MSDESILLVVGPSGSFVLGFSKFNTEADGLFFQALTRFFSGLTEHACCFDAKLAAEAAGSDLLRVTVALECAQVAARVRASDDAARLLQEANAIMTRIDLPIEVEAVHETTLALVAALDGRVSDAMGHLRRGNELYERSTGASVLNRVTALVNLCVIGNDGGTADVTLLETDCAKAAATIRAVAGEDSDALAGPELVLADLALRRGDREQALRSSEAALDRVEKVFGVDSVQTGPFVLLRGRALQEAGRPEALIVLRRAEALIACASDHRAEVLAALVVAEQRWGRTPAPRPQKCALR